MAKQTLEKNYIYTSSKMPVSLRLDTAYNDEGKLFEAEYEMCVEGDYFKLTPTQFVALIECVNDLMLAVNTEGLADDYFSMGDKP